MQAVDLAAGGDLLDEGGAGEGEVFAGHDEDGFDVAHRTVGQSQLKFVMQVGDISQATQDHRRPDLLCEIHGQSLIGLDGDILAVFIDDLLNHLDALVGGEDDVLIRVPPHCHDQLIKEGFSPLDDIHVAIGYRVEGPGKQRNFGFL